MHRIDGAGHIGSMFVPEDPAINRPPTEITPDILNAFQEELAGIVEWAGLGLVKADNSQLRQALLARFATQVGVQQAAYNSALAAGSGNAITATYIPAIDALVNGMTLHVRATAANTTASPTFSPDGLPAKPVVKGAGAALVAGDIAGAGQWLQLIYDATFDSWVLSNTVTAPAQSVPPGAVAHFAMASAPAGWIKANGATISRTTYAELYAAIGTVFGVGDGATTFTLPDLRGEFLRAVDDGRGVDIGRALGSAQFGTLITVDCDGTGGQTIMNLATTNPYSGINRVGCDPASAVDYPNVDRTSIASTGVTAMVTDPNIFGTARPRNMALLACIKY